MKLLRHDTTLSNDEFSSYVQSIKLLVTRKKRPIRWTTKPLIYFAKERRCVNLFMKEDRQQRNDFRCSSNQVTKQYGAYTASQATLTTSTIIEVTIDKSLQFQVNWLSIARDTNVKARPKKSSQNLKFCIPSVTLTLL